MVQATKQELPGARLDLEPEPGSVPDGTENARGVVDEAPGVQHTDQACPQIIAPVERVDGPVGRLPVEGDGHGVDGDVASGKVVLRAVHPSLEPGQAALGAMRRLDDEPPSEDRSLVAISVMALGGTESDITSLAIRLNLGSRWRTVIQDAVRLNGVVGSLARSQPANSELYEKLAIYDGTAIRSVMLASEDEVAAEMLALFLNELSQVETDLRGEDILAMGVEQGPAVGELLRRLKAARLDGAATDRAGEERFIQELIERGIS